MIYELILTDNCNRNCSFCDIKKSNYIETIENIQKFYSGIDKSEHYQLNLFGGEPLLNIDGINEIMHLVENDDCEIILVTNGDFIDRLSKIYNYKRIKVQVSAYDILEDSNKYKKMYDFLGDRMNLSYVFTEDNIDKVPDYKHICEDIGMKYIYMLSHSERSWKNISNDNLKKKIENLVEYEIRTHKPMVCDRYIKRFIELKEKGEITEQCCIDLSKKVFYKGHFTRGCILYDNQNIKDIVLNIGKCKDCYYRKMCFKSCFFERVNRNIPEKLCLIEKTLINSVFQMMV